MNPIIRNILGVIAGALVGGAVNMGLIMLSSTVIPPPEGINPANMESLRKGMHLFEPKHFIMPFLAYALGTLTGAFLAAKIVGSHKMKFALLIGVFFLIGGITNIFTLTSPVWFIVLDFVAAYLPMGWLGGKLAVGNR